MAFAADGAVTMMRAISGVQAKFKKIVPHIYIQKCLCHSLYLYSSYTSKKLPNVSEQFARDIHADFVHSTKTHNELTECKVQGGVF